MSATGKPTRAPSTQASDGDGLVLRRTDELAPMSSDSQDGASALLQRQQIDRDVQVELSLDAANRAKDQAVITAQLAAAKARTDADTLQRKLGDATDSSLRWQGMAGLGVATTLVAGIFWLRTRKRLNEHLSQALEPASTFGLGDSSTPDSMASQAALLPDETFANQDEMEFEHDLWSDDGVPSSATLHQISDAASSDFPSDPFESAHVRALAITDPSPAAAAPAQSLTVSSQRVAESLERQAPDEPVLSNAREALRDSGLTQRPNTLGLQPLLGHPSEKAHRPVSPGSPATTTPSTATLAAELQDALKPSRAAQASQGLGSLAKDLRDLASVIKPKVKSLHSSGFVQTAMPSGSSDSLMDDSALSELADVQWIPQPMQDLLLLYRGIQEWEAAARFGVAEQAILHHIEMHSATSGWVYLELLYIYRRQENRRAFDQWADAFRNRFNRLAPTWSDALHVGRDLLRYDLATLQLTQAWSNNSVIWLLEEWLVGEPHMRRLMDIQAFRDVLMLYELSLVVNENPYKPIQRPGRASRAPIAAVKGGVTAGTHLGTSAG